MKILELSLRKGVHMLQCLCGRSLRTSNSLSGEPVFFPWPANTPSLPRPLSFPLRASIPRGRWWWWKESVSLLGPDDGPRELSFFFKALKSSALYRMLQLSPSARPGTSVAVRGALGDLLSTASRLSPCDLRLGVALPPPGSCGCAGRERGL